MTSECNNVQGSIEAILSQAVSSKCTNTLQISSQQVDQELAVFSTRCTMIRQKQHSLKQSRKYAFTPPLPRQS
eukprot:4092624-Pleurochrysis_carterae.AAC.1